MGSVPSASHAVGLPGWVLTSADTVAAMKCRSLGGRRDIPRLPEVAEILMSHGRRAIAGALE